MKKKKYLIVIAGPTAVGKTDLSIRLAQYFDTEILSADSRQFYKELNIGTAKPSPKELFQVRHHLINSHSIQEYYHVGQYEVDALAILEDIFAKKDVAVLVGGSGLYIKALCDGMDKMPETDLEIRKELTLIWQSQGLEVLLDELKVSDPDYFEQVDRANTHRIIRALEVCRISGLPFSSFRTQAAVERPFFCIKIALQRDRELLYQRIEQRMDQMLEQGLIEEASTLLPYENHSALQTVGYQEVFGYLKGDYDQEEMVRLLKRNSRRYAKRQFTWFRKDEGMVWFEPTQEAEILRHIQSAINS
ncbi:MAG: tRNA (adenosine(37)-N6)-dimethylallyltransferase MiaA [Microscillaceae bacterium]|nr:tRNA (adenosine(37)-N6)-dimethylallyltransferase MiaA [Microscillaceae bacterium]